MLWQSSGLEYFNLKKRKALFVLNSQSSKKYFCVRGRGTSPDVITVGLRGPNPIHCGAVFLYHEMVIHSLRVDTG